MDRLMNGPEQLISRSDLERLFSAERLSTYLARLHVFRNRLAHHQRVWNQAPEERYEDLLALAGYVDPLLHAWIVNTSKVPHVLATRPAK